MTAANDLSVRWTFYRGTYALSPIMRDVTLAVHLARFFLRGLQ